MFCPDKIKNHEIILGITFAKTVNLSDKVAIVDNELLYLVRGVKMFFMTLSDL